MSYVRDAVVVSILTFAFTLFGLTGYLIVFPFCTAESPCHGLLPTIAFFGGWVLSGIVGGCIGLILGEKLIEKVVED